MLEELDNAWLKAFITVYERKSFKVAAETLNVPTTNISRYINQLEARFEAKLFYRTTRKISPTPLADSIYPKVKTLYFELSGFLDSVHAMSNTPAGKLNILTPDTPVIGNALSDFVLAYPEINVTNGSASYIENDIKRDPDVIISMERGDLHDQDWVSKELCRWDSAVLASPNSLMQFGQPKTIADLKAFPCISSVNAIGGNVWVFNDNQGRSISLPITPKIKSDNAFFIKSLTIKGAGLSVLPKHFCKSELNDGRLIEVKLDHQIEPLKFFIHYRPLKDRSYLSKIFVDFMLKFSLY
ncbi:LysR family transcriptional regulator [Vibrio sp. D404a]|uniref:LysR family transcriptional regulator n=1 Tax=unclassified Vibrio TaxID=2614977 RepID=UPI00255369AF|nr:MULTISPECIES: LysR family transcriptional regulator [unclassified Vibrio]MDK9735949.1 LysR family transcriptional regulator [Vibrio sp. D404a]MDK9797885.1 LysR family transcriptional regulator [Vibrio sp. D449a]